MPGRGWLACYTDGMTTPTRVTAEEFLAMEETKPYLELINGEVVQKAMPGPRHSATVRELLTDITTFFRQNPVAQADTELRHRQRSEERLFLPDICVTLNERWPTGATGPIEVMPDWAIEVLSPDDRPGRVAERVDFYLRAGTALIWIVDPDEESVTVYRPDTAPTFVRGEGKIEASPVVPGFVLDIGELFRVVRSR